MKFTAIGSGYYRVFKDGVEVSKHTSEREAIEASVNLEISDQTANITYKHDYEVKVESEITAQPPIVEPPPVIPPVVTPPTQSAVTIMDPSCIWYQKLADNAPLRNESAAMAIEIEKNAKAVAPTFSTTPWSRPFYEVHGNLIAKVPVDLVSPNDKTALAAQLSKGVPIPVGAQAGINGTDLHMAIRDLDSGEYFDFWGMKDPTRSGTGGWLAKWGGYVPDFSKCQGFIPRLPSGERQGAAATGIPIVAGVVQYEEVKAGKIPHVLSMALFHPYKTFVPPAVASDGDASQPAGLAWSPTIPEGQRFRLPTGFVVDQTLPPLLKCILEALRDYGIIITDRAGCNNIYVEDLYYMDNSAGNPWSAFRGGKQSYELAAMIPWAKLQAVA